MKKVLYQNQEYFVIKTGKTNTRISLKGDKAFTKLVSNRELTLLFKTKDRAARKEAKEQLPKKPHVKLVGIDGNAFALIGKVKQALRKAGYDSEQLGQFQKEAFSGDYDNVLQTCMKWAEVS